MDPIDLASADWWLSQDLVILENPRKPLDTDGLADFLYSVGQGNGLIVPTSGSLGVPKFIKLSREALLASAASVNRHLGATADDRWLCALPTFHVGGLGIWARAFQMGDSVFAELPTWDASDFSRLCTSCEITHTSLTPTQVHDLVSAELRAPRSLKTIVVGGGHLSSELRTEALELGWPLLRSYGMTESSSQIATESLQRDENGWLDVLDIWEVRHDPDTGCLQLRGAAAADGWAVRNDWDEWTWVDAADRDHWVQTRDLVELSDDHRRLRFLDRADDQIKILGELVSLSAARERFGPAGTIIARPHSRKGSELVAIIETTATQIAEAAVANYNQKSPGLEQIEVWELCSPLPRTPLGKINYSQLAPKSPT